MLCLLALSSLTVMCCSVCLFDPFLAGYLFMVLVVIWLLLILITVVGLLLMRLIGMFPGFVVLVLVGQEFD